MRWLPLILLSGCCQFQPVGAPELAGDGWIGEKTTLRNSRGQVVVLEMFNTECGLCKANALKLTRLHQRYREKGVVFVGVDPEPESREAVEEYVRMLRITYPVVYGAGTTGDRYEERHGFTHYPFEFVIGKDGKVRWTTRDRKKMRLEEAIDAALSD